MDIYTCAVITVSDSCSSGQRTDTAGPACCEIMKENGFSVIYTSVVADDIEQIKKELVKCTDELGITVVLTCGGTGFSKRDITPEAAEAVFDRKAYGFAEAMRAESLKITPKAVLSRATSGLRKESIIITLPGSEKAARENLLSIVKALSHGAEMVHSGGSANCGG